MATGSNQEPEPFQRSASAGVCEVDVIHPEVVQRVRAMLPDVDVTQDVAMIFGVLADPTRVRIVAALAHDELCVCDVAAVVGLSISTASHHLKRLRDQGVARFRKDGRLAFYRLSNAYISDLVAQAIDRVGQSK